MHNAITRVTAIHWRVILREHQENLKTLIKIQQAWKSLFVAKSRQLVRFELLSFTLQCNAQTTRPTCISVALPIFVAFVFFSD